MGIEAVRAVNSPGLGHTWPDLVALLQLDVAAGLLRQQDADRIGAAGHAFLDRVAEGFRRLAEAEPARFMIVDATLPVAEVAAAIWKVARDHG